MKNKNQVISVVVLVLIFVVQSVLLVYFWSAYNELQRQASAGGLTSPELVQSNEALAKENATLKQELHVYSDTEDGTAGDAAKTFLRTLYDRQYTQDTAANSYYVAIAKVRDSVSNAVYKKLLPPTGVIEENPELLIPDEEDETYTYMRLNDIRLYPRVIDANTIETVIISDLIITTQGQDTTSKYLYSLRLKKSEAGAWMIGQYDVVQISVNGGRGILND